MERSDRSNALHAGILARHALVLCLPRFRGTVLAERSDIAVLAIVAATLLGLHLGAPDLLIVSLFVALILLSVSDTGAFAKLVNTGPLIWLGEISYSLYLVHRLIQFAFSKGLGAYGSSTLPLCPLTNPSR